MHPAISRFPALTFYDGRISDDPSVLCRDPGLLAHPSTGQSAACLLWNGSQGESSEQLQRVRTVGAGGVGSRSNAAEASRAVELAIALSRVAGEASVAVLSWYNKQVANVTDMLKRAGYPGVHVGSIATAQGSEWDYVILSAVRSGGRGGSLGLVADPNNLNVALTRARLGLVILCDTIALEHDLCWGALIKSCKDQDFMISERPRVLPPPPGFVKKEREETPKDAVRSLPPPPPPVARTRCSPMPPPPPVYSAVPPPSEARLTMPAHPLAVTMDRMLSPALPAPQQFMLTPASSAMSLNNALNNTLIASLDAQIAGMLFSGLQASSLSHAGAAANFGMLCTANTPAALPPNNTPPRFSVPARQSLSSEAASLMNSAAPEFVPASSEVYSPGHAETPQLGAHKSSSNTDGRAAKSSEGSLEVRSSRAPWRSRKHASRSSASPVRKGGKRNRRTPRSSSSSSPSSSSDYKRRRGQTSEASHGADKHASGARNALFSGLPQHGKANKLMGG